ncbi:helix-turn-helix transcriptional regulator [Streptacidiphilus sp. N1-3]|uniref:Helix-turn-helix transcriptional regulator n=1 Tax=Streptacidiphilus alkalitolerans TaxID=3342712 RepID=A0ABV6WSW0_9ACTN
MDPFDGWITSEDACTRLGITWRTLYGQHRKSSDFPVPRKVGRTLLWNAAELDAWRIRHPKRKRRE